MNAYLQLTSESEPMLLIPSKALIDSGSEQRVITVDNEGRFVPKIVQVFHESTGVTAIRSGLQEGRKSRRQRPVPDRLGGQYRRRAGAHARAGP
ncbi:cobalt/zinc/cadmium efflux RND transporter, membrane fusion protein, CzcB family [Klebsiella pneumoniae]|nr:cobalt/zinc/cadmium efflux RND transporter, membrane fusion protein, CzcB family [Klebsiella pneumoniae]